MTDEISSITARIGEIQDRINSLAPAAPPPTSAMPGEAPAQTFAGALKTAQAAPMSAPSPAAVIGGPTQMPQGSSVTAPPASLGPLPGSLGPLSPLPISPGAANVVPTPHTEISAGYGSLIEKYAAQYGLAPSLVRAVIKTESDGDTHCVSPAGAMGLMQLMPDNVKEAGISDAFDPEQNIKAGTQQLAGLLAQYHGNLDLALAGYNAGPGNVHKYGGVPPFNETRNYIHRVRAAMEKG
jgi:soluble lytic murein transglycosylase-like protein